MKWEMIIMKHYRMYYLKESEDIGEVLNEYAADGYSLKEFIQGAWNVTNQYTDTGEIENPYISFLAAVFEIEIPK